MENPTQRRASFVQFLMATVPDDGKAEENSHFTPWQRLAHSTALFGYGQLLSFVAVVFSMWQSTVTFTEDQGDGVPRIDNWKVLRGLQLPFVVVYWILTILICYVSTHFVQSSPRLALVPALLGLALVPCYYGVHAALLVGEIDVRYYGLDLVGVVAFVAAMILADIRIRSKLVLGTWFWSAPTNERAPGQDNDDDAGEFNWVTIVPLIGSVIIAFAYPFAIIPLFFSSDTPTRMFICLVFHPLILEVSEAVTRGTQAHDSAEEHRNGNLLLAEAEARLFQSSLLNFPVKQLMAFFRRFMLLNMGSSASTLVAIVIAAIEEAFLRAFLVEIDTSIRKLRGLSELTGEELQLQRIVWTCDTNHSCIAEFTAILTTSFSYVVLQRNAAVFAIGYEPNVIVSADSVFVQLLVELALEILVDNTVMWAESEHGIPVRKFFELADSLGVFGVHASASVMTLCISLFAFIRYPQFSSCNSNDVCACLERPIFEAWYGDACDRDQNNISTLLNSTALETDSSAIDLFNSVDFFSVTIAVVAAFATLVLIALAVLFARYRKRQHAVVALQNTVSFAQEAMVQAEAKNRELKWLLERAQRAVDEAIGHSKAQLKPYSIRHSNILFERQIGDGAYGLVWKGIFNGEAVAIKTLRVTKVSKNVVEDFMKEIKLMAPLRHEFLVRLVGGCWEDGPDKLCVVLEYCGRGSLKNLLCDQLSGHSWETPYFAITLGVASCFQYLHHEQPSGEPIIHRDLKSDNVMICTDLSPRVGDFGESTRFDQEEALQRVAEDGAGVLSMTVTGTPMYAAPELLSGTPCEFCQGVRALGLNVALDIAPHVCVIRPADNKSVDVYSFGITLLEIASCEHTFVANQFAAMSLAASTMGFRPKPKKELVTKQPKLWELIKSCWAHNPEKRPSFIEIARRIEALAPTRNTMPTPGCSPKSLDSPTDFSAEPYEERQLVANARYRSLSGGERDLRLLEAEKLIVELQSSSSLHRPAEAQQTFTTKRGISLSVSFEYDPDEAASVLGEGSYGKVFAVKSNLDGKSYAMKRLTALTDAEGSVDADAMNELLREVQMLSHIRSDFFVRYVTSSVSREYLFVVMERLHGVQFRDLVVARKALEIPFHEHQIEQWMRQLATGLTYLHDEVNLVHQDLHSGNVMITWDPTEEAAQARLAAENDELLSNASQVKILDLGLASLQSERAARTVRAQTTRTMRAPRAGKRGSFIEIAASEVCGFKGIRAPEMWAAGADSLVRFGAKTDVWALGLLMCEAVLCSPNECWYEDRAALLSFGRDRTLQEAKIAEVSSISSRLGGLVAQMLEEAPTYRLSSREVLQALASQDSAIFPLPDQRFRSDGFSTKEWISAIRFDSTGDFLTWRHTQTQELLRILDDKRSPWNTLEHVSIPKNIRCEWRSTRGTTARMYRVTIPLECTDAKLVWTAATKSLGTAKFFTGGDRSITDFKILHTLDDPTLKGDSFFITWQVLKMPRPLPKRHFCAVTHANEELLLLSSVPLPLSGKEMLERAVGAEPLQGSLPGRVFHYSFKFEANASGGIQLVCLSQANLSVGESPYHSLLRRAASMSVDRVGVALVKGFRGMARRLNELADLLQREHRLGSTRNVVPSVCT